MTTPVIRLANNADAHSIALMSRYLIELGLRGWSWDPLRVTRAIRHRDTCVAVAEVDHELAGFAIAEFGDTRLHLSLLAVVPTLQRRGTGSALVRWLEQSALTAGMREIQLELRANNSGARFFYQALGFDFVRTMPAYYSGVETALRMRKELGIATEAVDTKLLFKNI
jgi:ribosomal protein S18 acetylase RimI-like enzyme